MSLRSAWLLVLVALGSGCASSTTPDGGARLDAGGDLDGGRSRDASFPTEEAGALDAGPCEPGAVAPCTTECGSTGRALCMGGSFGSCVLPVEGCNGADDDCDGAVDESVTRSCATACATPGLETCESGTWSACVPETSAAESCNGTDDDCDGTVDEDTAVYVEAASYVVLSGRHAGCDGSTQRYGPECNAAIHRHCGASACTASGFGPVENSGDAATVTCTNGETRNTTYTELSGHHGSCNGVERMGPNCNAAIHRHCTANGFASGFGPVEHSGDVAVVHCVPATLAETRSTTYTALAGHHAPCDGVGQRIGPDCNAAIHRWCRAAGFDSGFGPVENSGDTAFVTCVR